MRTATRTRRPEAISPTAHYTGYTWYHHGLSHPGLVTPEGRLFYHAMRPWNLASRLMGGPTLEGFLLARHRAIDMRLTQAIESGEVSQIIEVAAGLSPRGWDFSRRYAGRITYIEADLPHMSARKRQRLSRAGLESAGHRVVALNALADAGPQSLAGLADTLDPQRGVAIITEGLLNYFDRDAVLGMWKRFAATLHRFPQGLYLSDLHLGAHNLGANQRAFARILSTFVRGSVHIHFRTEDQAIAALRKQGFKKAELIHPEARAGKGGFADRKGAALVRVIQART